MGRLAARVGDLHICPQASGPILHAGGPVLPPGARMVLIGGLFAARVGDQAHCLFGPPDMISVGCPTVLIDGMPAARMGDNTLHGGTITSGCGTVLIGAEGVGLQGHIDDADPAQARMILKAHIEAVQMIDAAIARLKVAKSAPDSLINQYFSISGTDPDDQEKLTELIDKYQEMQEELVDVGYEAEAADPSSTVVGFVSKVKNETLGINHRYGDIHVNFPQFANQPEQERAATVVHEAGHRLVDAQDEVNSDGDKGYEGQPKWNNMSQDYQMENADSLGGFARDAK
jgi:uncharacterized Zn-binding protein involved in type VI secretion